MKAGLYARVSTNDGKQTVQNQLHDLREYAGRMGWTIAGEFTDSESGAEPARPGLVEMMTAAAARDFDVLLVFDLSRLTRLGPAAAFNHIEQLKNCGVQFWSMKEPHFRTMDPATGKRTSAGDVFIAVAAYMSEAERALLQQRIRSGMERARREGKAIGRPRTVIDEKRVLALLTAGRSIREVARILSVSKSTVERISRKNASEEE